MRGSYEGEGKCRGMRRSVGGEMGDRYEGEGKVERMEGGEGWEG